MDIITLAAAKEYTNRTVERIIEEGGSSSGNGGTTLKAGDFIEIKNGVIRTTFGDVISGELIEKKQEIYSASNIILEKDDSFYQYAAEGKSLKKEIDLNKKLNIEFTLPDNTTKLFEVDITSQDIDDGKAYQGFFNYSIENGFNKIDENSAALAIAIMIYSNLDPEDVFYELMIITDQDYSQASLSIYDKETVDNRKYALLPDEALGLGREIITEQERTVFSMNDIQLEEAEPLYIYQTEIEYNQVSIDDTVNIDIKLPSEDKTHNFTTKIRNFVITEEMAWLIAECNCILSIDQESGGPVVTILDPSLPSVVIVFLEENGYHGIMLITPQDYSGFSIICKQKYFETSYVKLTNKALSFDEEPSKDSENLVNSNGIYNALNKIKDSFVFDEEPTENSENFVNSGVIYNSIEELKEHIAQEVEEASPLFRGVADNYHYYGYSLNPTAFSTSPAAWIESGAANSHNLASAVGDNQWFLNVERTTYFYYITATVNLEYGIFELLKQTLKSYCDNAQYFKIQIVGENQIPKDIIFSKEQEEGSFVNIGFNGTLATLYLQAPKALEDSLYKYVGSSMISEILAIENVGRCSHSEGASIAKGDYSHAEGSGNVAEGDSSHVEGNYNTGTGQGVHVEGSNNTGTGHFAHAEGNRTEAKGNNSHTEGEGTIASSINQHAQGKWNIIDAENKYAHIIGNGKSNSERSNAHTVDWEGNAWYAGNIKSKGMEINIQPGDSYKVIETKSDFSVPLSGGTMIFGQEQLYDGVWYSIAINGVEEGPVLCNNETIRFSNISITYNDNQDNLSNIHIGPHNGEYFNITIELREYNGKSESLIVYIKQLEEKIQTLEEKLQNLNTETIEEVPLNETY